MSMQRLISGSSKGLYSSESDSLQFIRDQDQQRHKCRTSLEPSQYCLHLSGLFSTKTSIHGESWLWEQTRSCGRLSSTCNDTGLYKNQSEFIFHTTYQREQQLLNCVPRALSPNMVVAPHSLFENLLYKHRSLLRWANLETS